MKGNDFKLSKFYIFVIKCYSMSIFVDFGITMLYLMLPLTCKGWYWSAWSCWTIGPSKGPPNGYGRTLVKCVMCEYDNKAVVQSHAIVHSLHWPVVDIVNSVLILCPSFNFCVFCLDFEVNRLAHFVSGLLKYLPQVLWVLSKCLLILWAV